MTTSALIMALVTQVTIIGLTGYFFWRVLTAKPRPEPDSYSENDNESR